MDLLGNGLEEPVSTCFIRDGHIRAWSAVSPYEGNTVGFERERRELFEWHSPAHFELTERDREDPIVGQDGDRVVAWCVEVRDITVVEVCARLELLEPRLTESFTRRESLKIRSAGSVRSRHIMVAHS